MESVSSHWNKLSEVMQHNEYVYFSVWSERIRNTLFQYSNKEQEISTIRSAKLKVSMDSVIKVKDQVLVIDKEESEEAPWTFTQYDNVDDPSNITQTDLPIPRDPPFGDIRAEVNIRNE